METTTQAAEWGYANGGRTDKAHMFSADKKMSACGRYRRDTVIVFRAENGKRLTHTECPKCAAAV